jgi:4-hydroxymandelate oxidase
MAPSRGDAGEDVTEPGDLGKFLRVAGIRAAASRVLPGEVWDFLEGGAGDEITLRANERAYDRISLLPRVLCDVSTVSTAATALGVTIEAPVILAPVGFQRLYDTGGELASARAARNLGVGMAVSTAASCTLEEIAGIRPPLLWFQLYSYKDRAITRDLIGRAAASGYQAICLTVDTPAAGQRLRDLRNSFAIPADIRRANVPDGAAGENLASYVAASRDASLTWNDLEWIAGESHLPLVLKGILDPADVRHAARAGVAAVVISNHGGRQLDGAPPTISMLPPAVEAAGGEVEIYVDGGIRRGSDVAKAVALGARAVLVGRPYLWGLAAAGQAGVAHVLQLLRDELVLTMKLTGVAALDELAGRASALGFSWTDV